MEDKERYRPSDIPKSALSIMLTASLLLNGGYCMSVGADNTTPNDNSPSVSEKRKTDATLSKSATETVQKNSVSKDKKETKLSSGEVIETSIYDFEYKLSEDDEVIITKYIGTDTEVVIPEDFNGYYVIEIANEAFYRSNVTSVKLSSTVEKIGRQAFYDCTSLQTVDFGESLKEIGDNAFSYCYALESVDLPDTCTKIEYSAFYNCTGLKTLNLGQNMEFLGNSAFQYCYALESIVLPDSLTSMGTYCFYNNRTAKTVKFGKGLKNISYCAFSYCYALTSVEIPENLESIDDYAFSSCTALSEIIWSDNIKSIGKYAFASCYALTEFTIPDSVKSIGYEALNSCTNLKSIHLGKLVSDFTVDTISGDTLLDKFTVDKDNEYYSADSHGVLFNKEKTTLVRMGRGYEGSYVIPSTVTKIGRYAFSYCQKLNEVTMSKNIDTVDEYAFRGCTLLTDITFNDKLEHIGNNAFYECSALESIDFGSALQTIGSGAFYNCNKLNNITIPDSCTTLENGAFQYCRSLSKITLGNKLVTISHYCFYYCSALTEIDLPESLKTIGDNAFGGTPLEEVTIPDGVETLGSWAFSSCSKMKKLHIGNSIKSLPSYVFTSCTALEEIDFPSSLQSIGYESFYNCTSLSSISLNEGLTSIGSYAFQRCTALTEVVLPESLVSMSDSAFRDCTSLKSVTADKNLTSLWAGAFYNCTALEEINVSKDNITFASVDGVVFDKHCTEILIFPRAKSGKYKIPDTVTKINNNAFDNATKLTEVTIGEAVESIGSSAFVGCKSLEKIQINENCGTVGDSAFNGCTALKTVTLGKYTHTIGNYTFAGCTALENISLGERLSYIPYEAFYNCQSLKSISFPDTVKSTGSYSFQNCSSLEEVNLGEGIESIGYYSFGGTAIKNIIIPDTVKSIGNYVFSYTPLKEITIGKGLSSMDVYYNFPSTLETITVSDENLTFSSADNVLYNRDMSELIYCPRGRTAEFTIPDTVTTLSDFAFQYCSKLTAIKEYGNVTAGTSNTIYGLDKANFTAYVTENSYLHKLFADNGYTCEIIEDTRTQVSDCDLRYDKYVEYGYSVKANLKIFDGDKELIENKDFKAYYSNAGYWATGEATITVYGMGEYGGNTAVKFYIYRPFASTFDIKRTGAATYTLKNSPIEGVPEYTNKFEFAKTEDVQAGNPVWTTIPNPDNLSSVAYFFEEDGEFTVRSTVTDKIDNMVVKQQEISVTAPRARMSFSDDKAVFGKTITVTAYGNNFGKNKRYQFEVNYGEAEEWTVVSEFSTTNRNIDLTFDKTGIYQVRLTVTDDAGNTAEKTQRFEIVKPSVDFVLSKPPALNEEVLIKTSIDAVADDYAYKYEYRKSGESSWTLIKNFTSAKNCACSFADAGTYQIRVTSRYKNDTTIKSTKVKSVVLSKPIVTLTAPETAEMGTQATLKASTAFLGEAVTYKYQYKSVTDTQWRNLYNGAETSAKLTLQQTGNYTVRVIATDGFGNKSTSTKKIAVTGAVVELLADNNKVYVGDTVQLSTRFKSYQGSTADYTYKFEYRECLSSTWHTLQDYSNNGSAKFNARQCATSDQYAQYAGMYEMKVTAKDGNGVTSTSVITVLVKKMELTFGLSEYNVVPDTEVTLSANVVGGEKPVKFMYEFKKDNGIWQPLVHSNYTENDVIRFKFSAEGTYQIRVSAKDKNGLTIGNTADVGGVGYEGEVKTLKVQKPVVHTLTSSVYPTSTRILKGKDVKITAYSQYATGDVKYQFTVKHSSSSEETILQDFDSNDQIIFNGEQEGTYYITVTVKDSVGHTSTSTATISVTDYALSISSNYPEVTSGRDFHISANVSYSDENVYRFKYEYRLKGSSTWKTVSDFTEERVQRFNLYTTGVYDIKVTAQNSEGIEKTATMSVKVNEKLNSFISAMPSHITVNSDTVLICTATGGTGNITYEYEYCLTGTGEWHKFSTDNTSSVTTFSADTAGVYKIRATAKDITGASKRTEQIKVYVK